MSVGKASSEFKSFPKQGKNLFFHFVSFSNRSQLFLRLTILWFSSQFSLNLSIVSLHLSTSTLPFPLVVSTVYCSVKCIDALEGSGGVEWGRVIFLFCDKAMYMYLKVICKIISATVIQLPAAVA